MVHPDLSMGARQSMKALFLALTGLICAAAGAIEFSYNPYSALWVICNFISICFCFAALMKIYSIGDE